MAIPDFIVQLRQHVGTAQLWLSGITAVITDPQCRQVLLVKRADNGQWTPVTGIIDPGEHPGTAAARETWEEANVLAKPQRLVSVDVVGPMQYSNGDRAQYLDLTFHLQYERGEPLPADGENTEVRWFDVTDLPELNQRFQRAIRLTLSEDEAAAFECDFDFNV